MTETTGFYNEELDIQDELSEIKQLVAFLLGSEIFCLDINKVREINRIVEITTLPEAPEFVEGVIDLRGQIVPVVDLRKRFSVAVNLDKLKDNRIMVIETQKRTIGFIVDEVQKVLRIRQDEIVPPPDIISGKVHRKYIEGLVNVDSRLHIILNAELIFQFEELNDLEEFSPLEKTEMD